MTYEEVFLVLECFLSSSVPLEPSVHQSNCSLMGTLTHICLQIQRLVITSFALRRALLRFKNTCGDAPLLLLPILVDGEGE